MEVESQQTPLDGHDSHAQSIPSNNQQELLEAQQKPKANKNENDGCRNNAKLIALADMLVLLIVMIAGMVFIFEISVTGNKVSSWRYDQSTEIQLAVHFVFVIAIAVGPFFATGLIKSTNLKTNRRDAIRRTSWWLWFSTAFQILTVILITVSFLYDRNAEAGMGMGLFLLRMTFMIVVVRFLGELDPDGTSVAVGPAHPSL